MLQHRVVQQLVGLSHLAVDEPGQVRGRVAAVTGAVQSEIKHGSIPLIHFLLPDEGIVWMWKWIQGLQCIIGIPPLSFPALTTHSPLH